LKTLQVKIGLLFLLSFSAYGQFHTHGIGAHLGLSKIQTDYGQRGDFSSNSSNQGMTISVAHYLSFFKKNTRWNSADEMYNNIMLKTELTYMPKVKLNHFGKWIEGSSDLARQLKAMHGSLSMLHLGVNIEYYLKNLEDFAYPYSYIDWNPFFTFGLKYTFYKNDIVSDLGDWRVDNTVLPQKYRVPGALDIGKGGALSFNLGFGTRFKLTEKIDLAAQANWQIYFSDAIDGLQANVIENKNNEWMVNFQIGVVYHLNFNTPLFYR